MFCVLPLKSGIIICHMKKQEKNKNKAGSDFPDHFIG